MSPAAIRPNRPGLRPFLTLGWSCVLASGLIVGLTPAGRTAEPLAAAAAPARLPYWIWGPTNGVSPGAGAKVTLRRTVEEPRAIQSARLRLVGDHCRATVRVHGQVVASYEPYTPRHDLDLTPFWRRGANQLEVEAEAVPGPAAIAMSLEWHPLGGPVGTLVSDRAWTVGEGQPAVERGQVAATSWGQGRRGIDLAPDENYEQWRQTLGPAAAERRPRFWTAPGFDVSLVRLAAPEEGSWISMAFDDRGRLTISREDRGLLRLTLDEQRTQVTRVEPVDAELLECRGLLYHDGWLYANANNSKALYRLRIDDTGKAQDMTRLREFPGGVGHGRNDLARVGDRLLSIHGDSVETPASSVLDLTSPLREARRGPPGREGYVMRHSLVTGAWELLCSGLRNPYGIAAHPSGDLFTFDADNEFDMGTPWYRPTRIVHLVPGGDTGYREASGGWPPRFHDQPDMTPPVLDIGRSSPTSVMFGDALSFPEEYRRALLALDWTYGRVLAVHLEPRGAGWRGSAELFLQGRPLNVTDLAAGPDGALYLITGGRKTQSALYRVTATASPVVAAATPDPQAAAAAEFAATQRARRVRLEQLASGANTPDPNQPLTEAQESLADPDPLIRHAARILLERQPLGTWRDWAVSELPPEQAIPALLALSRGGRAADVPAILDRLIALPLPRLGVGQRLTAIRIVQLGLAASEEAVRSRRAPLTSQLLTLWEPRTEPRQVAIEGASDELRRRLALLLAQLEATDLPRLAARDLLASDVQEDQLAALLALRLMRTGWTLEWRQQQFAALQQAVHGVGGQGMPGFIERLRTDALATLSAAEQQQLASWLTPTPAVDEPLPPPRPTIRAWTLTDLQPLTDLTAPRGDPARGAQVFREALCSRCHRVGVRGPAVGPDLTFVGRRFSRRDMLESILTPAAAVAENYRNVQVVTEQGKTYVGRVVSEGDYRSEKLKLSLDPLRPGSLLELDKREIAELRPLESSPMPQGLLDGFPLESIRDLLAFLESGGAPAAR